MGPEAKFYKYFKSKTPEIIYTRIENTSSLGTPDALCYNANQFYFTIEFKVSKRNKVSLSPHQIAYHVKHPKNSFILVKTPEACGLRPARTRLVATHRIPVRAAPVVVYHLNG